MTQSVDRFLIVLLFLVCCVTSAQPSPAAFINRIEGQVYGPDRRPVENARVELLNEVESSVASSKTDSSGRFTFVGMVSGRYNVHVMAFATNYAEQTQEVIITNARPLGSDIAFVQFYLTIDQRARPTVRDTATDLLFVQEIPPEAKKLFQDGADDLKSLRTPGGLARIENALKVFPNYFDALNLIAKHYVIQKEYTMAYPYLLRAIDVNSRNFSCYFRLAFSFYQMRQYPAALEASRAAVVLSPGSADAMSLYGTLLRIQGKYPESEKALLKANSLFEGKNADTHMQLAYLYNRLNNNGKAVDELRLYLKLNPAASDKAAVEELINKLQHSSTIPK